MHGEDDGRDVRCDRRWLGCGRNDGRRPREFGEVGVVILHVLFVIGAEYSRQRVEPAAPPSNANNLTLIYVRVLLGVIPRLSLRMETT